MHRGKGMDRWNFLCSFVRCRRKRDLRPPPSKPKKKVTNERNIFFISLLKRFKKVLHSIDTQVQALTLLVHGRVSDVLIKSQQKKLWRSGGNSLKSTELGNILNYVIKKLTLEKKFWYTYGFVEVNEIRFLLVRVINSLANG